MKSGLPCLKVMSIFVILNALISVCIFIIYNQKGDHFDNLSKSKQNRILRKVYAKIIISIQIILTNMTANFSSLSSLASIPFITFSTQKGYHLEEQAISFLSALPDEDDYSVVAIVGKSKTGKSFLMNQLISNPNMFPVSNSIDNCHHGIRIATDLIQHENRKIILLDVQGFGSIEGNDDRDCKFFVLAILLSTVIIYNSTGTIDEQSLNNLSMVIEVGKILQKQLINPTFFPSLFWVLRDFSLKMQDKHGYQITANQYLQNALEEQKGQSQITFQKNRIRRIIKTLFSERKCETIVLPTQEITFSPENMECLRKQFLQDFDKFKSKLLTMVKKKGSKEFCGIKMTRDSFIDATKIYIQTMNRSISEGTMPKIENITFKLRESQAQCFITKFNVYLEERKEHFLEKIVAIKKESESKKNKSEFLHNYQKTIQPIENFYETIRKNIYELTGELKEDSELEKIKKLFYQTIEKESEQKMCVDEEQKEEEEMNDEEEEQEMRVANICEFFTHIMDEGELEREYFHEIKDLRSRHVNKSNMYFANLLMKLEIAFLRRKIDLGRENTRKMQELQLQLKFSQKQVQNLSKRNKELENELIGHARDSRKRSYVTPNKNLQNFNSYAKQSQTSKVENYEFSSYSKFHKQNNFASNSKIESLSFYVPYVTIEKSDYLKTKIIRTLIKEDSRRNSYIQYVIQVVLLDQKWVLNRKFKDFSELHSILVMMYQSLKLPECQAITGCVRMLESNPQLRKQIVQVRRKELQVYMGELILIQGIRNSRILQKFLKINKEYTVL